MRFMVMAILEGRGATTPNAAAGSEAAAKMREYDGSLQRAGVLLARDGLLPPSTGARISLVDGRPAVEDGLSVPSRGALGGFWILQVRSREEAIEWAKRSPMSSDEVIEVRQIRETSDGPEGVRGGGRREPLVR